MDGPFSLGGFIVAIAAGTGLVYRAAGWARFALIAAVLCVLADLAVAYVATSMFGFDTPLFHPGVAASRFAYTLIVAALAFWYRQLDIGILRIVVCLGTDVLLQGLIYAGLELLLPGAAIEFYDSR